MLLMEIQCIIKCIIKTFFLKSYHTFKLKVWVFECDEWNWCQSVSEERIFIYILDRAPLIFHKGNVKRKENLFTSNEEITVHCQHCAKFNNKPEWKSVFTIIQRPVICCWAKPQLVSCFYIFGSMSKLPYEPLCLLVGWMVGRKVCLNFLKR